MNSIVEQSLAVAQLVERWTVEVIIRIPLVTGSIPVSEKSIIPFK